MTLMRYIPSERRFEPEIRRAWLRERLLAIIAMDGLDTATEPFWCAFEIRQ